MSSSSTIRSLVLSASRLGRLAAVSTGNTTPVATWRTLSILRSDGPMRVGELATASRVSQPGMTRLIAQLGDEGLVARIADSSDARAWQIRITEKGTEALLAWYAQLGTALDPFFEGLDADDWEVLDRAAELLESRTRAPQRAAS